MIHGPTILTNISLCYNYTVERPVRERDRDGEQQGEKQPRMDVSLHRSPVQFRRDVARGGGVVALERCLFSKNAISFNIFVCDLTTSLTSTAALGPGSSSMKLLSADDECVLQHHILEHAFVVGGHRTNGLVPNAFGVNSCRIHRGTQTDAQQYSEYALEERATPINGRGLHGTRHRRGGRRGESRGRSYRRRSR